MLMYNFRSVASFRDMCTLAARFIDEQEKLNKKNLVYSLPYTDLIAGKGEKFGHNF